VDHVGKPFKGVVNVDIRDSVPDWEPYTQPIAPEGSPNFLYVVLDDVGFSAMEPFGGLIETPTSTGSRSAAWFTRTSTRRRCARRRARAC
jgi:hypothetical protein